MSVDWSELFRLSVSPIELIVRGTAMYWFLFLLFRVVIRRRIGAVGMGDILILVIVADAAQNAMSGEYRSITDGFILVGTLIAWTVLSDWLSFRFPALEKILQPPPLLLVRDGRIQHRNLRHEFVSEDELRSKLREKGVADLGVVKEAHMESDGEVSVVRADGK
ncbi:MAG: DUF421 domain-containing protein [Betaproteobacteria bacterium]